MILYCSMLYYNILYCSISYYSSIGSPTWVNKWIFKSCWALVTMWSCNNLWVIGTPFPRQAFSMSYNMNFEQSLCFCNPLPPRALSHKPCSGAGSGIPFWYIPFIIICLIQARSISHRKYSVKAKSRTEQSVSQHGRDCLWQVSLLIPYPWNPIKLLYEPGRTRANQSVLYYIVLCYNISHCIIMYDTIL